MHSFFDRTNGAEHEPKQKYDPAGVEDRGEPAGPENASRTGRDAGYNWHEGEAAAAHQQKKRDRFANLRGANGQPGLVSIRLDLARASPDEPDKPKRDQPKQCERDR